MSIIWSENGQSWERKQGKQFRPFRPRLTASDIVGRAAEKDRKALAYVNAQRPRQTVPYKRARLWQVGIACFVGAVLIYWHFLAPLAWRLFR